MQTRNLALLTMLTTAALAAAPTAATDRPLEVVPGDGAVQLAWEDTGAPTYDVLRDGTVIATTTAAEHLDVVSDTGEHTYEVLADGTPIGLPLTTVAADTTVVDDEVQVQVLRVFEGGARLMVTLPNDGDEVAAVQVHAEGELLGRHVATGGHVVLDVWGLTPTLLDTLEFVLEDLVGNTTIAASGAGGGLSLLLTLERLRDLPLPPVRVRVSACDEDTTVTWDALGSHSGTWAVSYDDSNGWFTVDEPRATIPADVTTFRLATFNDGRRSDWTPPIVNRTTRAALRGVQTCAVQVTEPGHVEGVQVTTSNHQGTTWATADVAGATATLFVDGDGVAGARISGASVTTPFHVGAEGDGRRVHVPLRAAQVGTHGTVQAELLGPDGQTLATVDVPIPTARIALPTDGGDLEVTLLGEMARVTSTAVDHDRAVLRDGAVVGHLPAGATRIDVAGHEVGHVHAYQLRGIGDLPLTSRPQVVTR